jgi:peptidoglycan-N-acetylglucosamine deacetylase
VGRGTRTAVIAGAFIALNVSGDVYQRVVSVQGRSVAIGRSLRTVSDVLAAARQPLATGAVRAAVSGRVLVPDNDPARIAVNGRSASTATLLRPGDDVWVTNGVDTREPVAERQVIGSLPPLPAVETTLWRTGRPEVEGIRIGEMSGEVVSRSVLEPERKPEPETEKVVALTFDDGPDPEWTPRVMEILRDEGVPATFCVLASAGLRFPELVRAQHDAGHTHCDHTVDHRRLAPRSHDQIVEQIGGGADFLTSVNGVRPELFRAPYGVLSPEVVDVAAAMQLRVLGWTVDSADYLKSPADALVARVMSQIRPGAIVLLHDGGGDRANTVAALRPLIRSLKAEGYAFSTPTRQPPVASVGEVIHPTRP